MVSNKGKVKFSIIVPTYNRAHLIGKTLDSILSQTHRSFELIVVDDGSTDNTEEYILKNYPNQVRYYKKQNAERAAARNFGTQSAQGKYVLWFDSDDLMYPNYLEVADRIIVNKSEPELIALSHHYLNSDNEVISVQVIPENVNELLYKGNFFACNAVVVRKDIALENLFNEDRELTASEDYELWLRLGSQYAFYTDKEITWALIVHEERSVSTMADASKLILRFEKFLKYTTENEKLMTFLGNKSSYFIMKNYLILAVDLALNKHKKEAVKYLKLSIKADKSVFFTRTFYATLKHLAL